MQFQYYSCLNCCYYYYYYCCCWSLWFFFVIFIVNDNHWRTSFTVHEMPCTWNQVDQKSYKSISISISILFAFHFSFVYLFYGCWCYCCCFLFVYSHSITFYQCARAWIHFNKHWKIYKKLVRMTLIIEWRLRT